MFLLSHLTLWVITQTAFLLTSVVSQEPPPNEVIPTELPSPLQCVNGEFLDGSCVCNLGWAGELCDTCIRGRIK